jgi:hypothetical protein
MTALLIGTLLAVASLCYVLYPLLRPGPAAPLPLPPLPAGAATATAVDALRELEFDRQTGKISDTDYGSLKARYTAEAVEGMRAAESGGKVCPRCGPRPEADAAFCSRCGAALAG